MSILRLPAAGWQTARYNRDCLRYVWTGLVRPSADELLTFRLRNGQTVTTHGSTRWVLNEISVHRVYDVPGVEFSRCRQIFPSPSTSLLRGDLALGGAVNAGIGRAGVLAIEVGLGFVQALEAQALERRGLRVPHRRFDFAFAIGVADATGQRDDAVVRQHVPAEGAERAGS